MSKVDTVPVSHESSLERELKIASLVRYQNGKIIGYSMPPKESLAAQKIRRTLLRNLEVYLDEKHTGSQTSEQWPITYNLTRKSPAGYYKSHYTVTVSPYVEYPSELNVYNITRYDNFEGIPYIAYRYHHNYEKQGCPEVCKKEHVENRFGSGCPTGQEPHHGLIKRSFVQQHNLKLSVERGEKVLIFDHVHTKETHLADVYDQDLEVTVESTLDFDYANHDGIPREDISGQVFKEDLDDLTEEVQEEEWEDECKYPDIRSMISKAVSILDEIAEIVLKDDANSENSKEIGHKIVTLQKYMQRFAVGDFRTLQQSVKNYDQLSQASEKDKIKRQIWLDILPTVGTPESVSFIVSHILEYINLRVKGISFWEAKSLIEALPQNIHHPNERTINDLSRLLDAVKKETTGYSLFYSAAYMAVARVIRKSCAYPLPEQSEEMNIQSSEERPSVRNMWRSMPSQSQPLRDGERSKFNMYLECPERAANEYVEKVTNLLLNTKNKAKRVIYIEALALTGLPQVLPTLRKYVHGDRHEPLFSGLSQSYIDFLKTSTIFTLHNLVGRSSQEVQDMLVPVFFNVTQHPKVRNAAFSVIVKSQPSLALLEQVAAQSWKEPSQAVANYVTSTFESYGNSSLPCYQILAQRFKKVFPQLRKYDGGLFKARNVLRDMWDESTGYGIEKRCDFIPSNESFVPSVVYGAVGYNNGNLKDYLYQFAAQIQGTSSRHIWHELLKNLGLPTTTDIPKDIESSIFSNMELSPRDPEPWKAILFQKIFYTNSYYYLDSDDFTGKDLTKLALDLFTHYIQKDGNTWSGHLTKLYIPTAFHTKSIFKALPFPVHFEMKSPVLLSLKFKLTPESSSPSPLLFKVEAQPSMYQSHILTNEIVNLQDCKRVGVYYEQKTVFSYPFTSTVGVLSTGHFAFDYKLPKVPQIVFSHRSEAGTYAGKNWYEPLPPTEDRRTIKTRPAQFRYPLSFNYQGLPSFAGEVKTEDLQFGMGPLPRNWQETALYIHRFYMNAGWRRRSIDISRMPENIQGYPSDELRYRFSFWRDYKTVTGGKPEADWHKDLKFEDELKEKDTTHYAAEGRKIYEKISKSLSHIKDNLDVSVYHSVKSEMHKISSINMQYYHTFGGYLHLLHMNATTKQQPEKSYELTTDYAIGFINMPNEFKYNQRYGQQKGIAIIGTSFCVSTPFLNPSIAAKAVFDYKPLDQVLPLARDESVDAKAFEPDTHEECLRNMRQGIYQSPACIKAIREKSLYNHIRMQTVWTKETPEYLAEVAKIVELAMRHAYFTQTRVSKKPLTSERQTNSVRFEATYIDKMTDEPLVDISVEKPTEIVNYTMIRVGKVRPLSSIVSMGQNQGYAVSNNTYPAVCSITGNYVTTYDMQVYRMPDPSCTYVLSAHCTNQKKFAVLVKYENGDAKVSEVKIHLGEDKIVLVPGSGSTYKVEFNGKPYTLKNMEHALLNKLARVTAQVFKTSDGSSFVKILAERAGVEIFYDGEHVKVHVYPRYKGELCGLCSEYDEEISREFRGVDRCLYKDASFFAKSAIVGRCGGKKQKGREIALCENEEVTPHFARGKSSSEEDDSEGYEPVSKRNIVNTVGSKICFSTKPVPVCENSAQPMMTESRVVDFHCLPKQDVHARKMVTESKRRILGELETKAVDFSERVEVAKMC